MTIACALLLLATTSAAPGQAANGSLTFDYTLEITANRQPGNSSQWDFSNRAVIAVRTGAVVDLAVRKVNTSHQEILKFPVPYDWAIRNAGGDRLSPCRQESRDGWIRFGGPGILRGTNDVFLEPGESLIRVSTLGGCYVSQPGTYTVQVSQHTSSDPNSPEIQSNVITISVLPAEKTNK